MFRFLIAVICSIFAAAGISAQTWQDKFDTLIKTPPGPGQDSLIAQVVAAGPVWQDVQAKIESLPFPDTAKGRAFLRQTLCIDGVTRPYVIYVPSSYDPKTPTPMLISLHGLVSRPNIMANPKEEVEIVHESKTWVEPARSERHLPAERNG